MSFKHLCENAIQNLSDPTPQRGDGHINDILHRRDIWYTTLSVEGKHTDYVTVGFYTGSLALIADAFHYVCR